jgi:ubiquinone/menaquinone biosynthesis C-methylase UbiE
MHDYFIANPDKWREYHESREENKKDSSRWTKDPIDTIAEKLNRECCNLVIADIGCGTNMLKTKVKSYKKWYSVDHYSDDSTVIKADAANLKDYIEDNSVDCAVFCLSLWGVNYLDSIKEAYRYLKPGGKMYIVKPEDKVNQDKILQEVLGMGFRLDGYSTDVDNKPKCTYIYYSKI